MKIIKSILIISLTIMPSVAFAESNAQIKKAIIQESIDIYPGKCPCPYHTDRRGHSCGGRSAYSRASGYSVMCYPKDVSDQDIQDYKDDHKLQTN